MTPDRWRRITEVFHAVLAREPEARAALLDEACAGDPALRAEVDQMLAAHRDAGRFGEGPPLTVSGDEAPALGRGAALGPYRIEALIGAGGMGEVYRARDTRLDRDVAVKVLPSHVASEPQWKQRLEREARALAALSHPHICPVFDIGEQDGVEYLVMEYLEGETLASRLAKGPVRLPQALRWAIEIAGALDAAHRRSLVHRDLKPGNVMLTKGGARLLDFGLARLRPAPAGAVTADRAPTGSTLTGEGRIVGTLHYMAPEQLRGEPADARSDIFAFGVVVYEMVTGKRAFDASSQAGVIVAILEHEPEPIATLSPAAPAALDHLVRTCLSKEPDQRWQSAGDLERNLKWLLAEGSGVAAPGVRARAVAMVALVRLLPWLLAAAAMIAAVWALSVRRAPEAGLLQVQQFDVGFPEVIEPVPYYDSGFALSPDGRLVAMVGVKNGVRSLFVRRLDSAEVHEIAESGGVNGAAFSPDSTKVALLSTQVTAVSLVDRQRTVVASNVDQVGGVAWGGAGIVFSQSSALWIAPTGGGEPRALTALDAARHEVLHAGPLFLPGGHTILFSSLTTEPGTQRIEAVPVDGGERSVVLERATTPVWSPTGHLLFARDGAVLATEFDEETLQVQGGAAPVLPPGSVGVFLRGALGLRLAANGSLLFIPEDFHSQRLVSVARDGSALPLDLPRGTYLNPRLSPDGFRVMVESEFTHLEVLNRERGTRAQLTTAAAGTSFGIWNRDGSRVVYRRIPSPFWMSADGSRQQREITGAWANDAPSAPGPDADSILVNRSQPETSTDVFLLSLNGAFEPRPLISTRAYEGGAQLSPNGRWLAYVSNESGRFQIYVRRFPELDRQWQVSEGGGIQLRWSATGREIYYRGGPVLMAVPFDGRASEPVMGKPQPLFRDEYDLGLGVTIANYDVTPEGRFLMLRREGQGGHLRIVLNWTEELKRTLAKP